MLKGIRAAPQYRPSSSYICKHCQHKLRPSLPRSTLEQKRWITRRHIQRIKDATEVWKEREVAVEEGRKQSMLSLLEERGYVNQVIGNRDDLERLMTHRRCGAYVGVDPTAPSLHVGHLIPFMALGWMYIHGHPSTFLLGGSTSRIGDPTDRLTARDAVHASTRKANTVNMHTQLKKLGVFMEKSARSHGYWREWAWKRTVINNHEWWDRLVMLDFLKIMGHGMRIGPLLGRDTVKTRMERGGGMSFAEFSYPLMQAWDWWQLYQKGTQIQIGGGDQFGNILAGTEAVRYMAKNDPVWRNSQPEAKSHTTHHKIHGRKGDDKVSDDAMGFTVPLLTTSAGEKFGKSAGNAIWLDKDMTSTYDLYQFFLRSADEDVERYLKLLTFIPTPQITKLMEEHNLDQSQRVAQHKLAREFIELIHGSVAAEEAAAQHGQMFNRSLSVAGLRSAQTESTKDNQTVAPTGGSLNPSVDKYAAQTNAENGPPIRVKLPKSLVEQQPIPRILWSAGMVASKSEGVRLIGQRGCHIGTAASGEEEMGDSLRYQAVDNTAPGEADKHIIGGNLLVLRVGKWKHKIINIVSDQEYEESGLTCPGWKEQGESKAEKDSWKNAQKQRQLFLEQRKQNKKAAFSVVQGVD